MELETLLNNLFKFACSLKSLCTTASM